MQPFATFSIHDGIVRLRADRGGNVGIWLVHAWFIAGEEDEQKIEIRTRQPCAFGDLHAQHLVPIINEVFDETKGITNAGFIVYKLRSAKRGH